MITVGYSDFVALCGVDNVETWDDGLSIRNDGVYVKIPSETSCSEERAVLSEHPTGNLDDPALRFPCKFEEFRDFIADFGLTGCIDAFAMADWMTNQMSSQPGPSKDRKNFSDKLSYLIQAADKFWGSAVEGEWDTYPDTQSIVAWLHGHDRGFSSSLANKGATIIRPKWALSGRPPEKL